MSASDAQMLRDTIISQDRQIQALRAQLRIMAIANGKYRDEIAELKQFLAVLGYKTLKESDDG